jgi:hypothetical protein
VPKDDLSAYRQHLVLAEQKAQEDYDKTVLSLAGGALGVSFAFIDKFIPDDRVVWPAMLVTAWAFWALSVGFVLVSYFLSRAALRKAIRQTDSGEIRSVSPGGAWSRAVLACNASAGGAFLLGVIVIAVFVYRNMRG